MCPCQCLLCLGLAASVAVSHDPPHVHPPASGEQAVWFGTAAVSSTTRADVVVNPGTGELTVNGFAPTVTVSSTGGHG